MKQLRSVLVLLAAIGLAAVIQATEIKIFETSDESPPVVTSTPVVIQYSSGSWQDVQVVASEEYLKFTGWKKADLGNGFFDAGLSEPGFPVSAGLSDYISVKWTQPDPDVKHTDFVIEFFSDSDPSLLQGFNPGLVAEESSDGNKFGLNPSDGLPNGIVIFVKSDVEVHAPDGGATLALLGLALAGLGLARRKV